MHGISWKRISIVDHGLPGRAPSLSRVYPGSTKQRPNRKFDARRGCYVAMWAAFAANGAPGNARRMNAGETILAARGPSVAPLLDTDRTANAGDEAMARRAIPYCLTQRTALFAFASSNSA